MKTLILLGAAALSFGVAGTASAQMSNQTTTTMQMPNGNVRTTSHVDGPGGSATTRTVDRADGSRTVVRRTTDSMGDSRTVRHDMSEGRDMGRHDMGRNDRGWHRDGRWNRVKVCRNVWWHGHRERRCTWQRR